MIVKSHARRSSSVVSTGSSACSTGPRHATMSIFTIEEILEVLSAKVVSGQSPQSLKKRIRRVISDSRLVRGGDLFVAFVGDRYDGHAFVPAALAQGAVGAIVQEDYALPPQTKRMVRPVLLGVKDTLLAYQQLATHHRNRFTIPLIAITGSNGKTTTKDMVASVLAQRWRTLKTEGNLNNRIGVPQTLFQLTPRHQAAVIEMGVDQQGQTLRLCDIARPTIGIITNIGPDHLEFLGSMEGSAQAKAELLDKLPPDGVVVLNADDQYFDYLAARAQCRVVSFGMSSKAEVRAEQAHEETGGRDRCLAWSCRDVHVRRVCLFARMGCITSRMRWQQLPSATCWDCPVRRSQKDCPVSGRLRCGRRSACVMACSSSMIVTTRIRPR